MLFKIMKKKNKFNKGFTHTLTFTKQLCCAPSAYCKSKCRGFTLVETLIAISIFTVSLLGIMSVLASGIADTNYAKRKMTATYLAQEGIEYIRNMRDTFVLYPANGGWSGGGSFTNRLGNCDASTGCGVDISRPVTDTNFTFRCTPSSKCKLYVNNGNYNTNNLVGDDSGFTRKIWMDIIPGPDDGVKISSKVEWTQGSGTKSVTFSENLYNWY